MGWGILILWGAPSNEAIFVGASMVATSVGITAQVLSAKGLLHAVSSKIILAAAVIDDVLGLLVLAVVSSLTHGKLNILALSLTAALAVGFTVIVAKWGTHAMGRVVPHVDQKLRVGEAQFALAMSLLFALSLAAVYIGVAAIVGAFLAGLALAESTGPGYGTWRTASRSCWSPSSLPESGCTSAWRRFPPRVTLCWPS